MPYSKKRRDLLVAQMSRYVGGKNPDIATRLSRALVSSRPSVLRDLIDDLQSLEELNVKANEKLRAAYTLRAGDTNAAQMMDKLIASLKQVNDIADAIADRLRDLLTRQPDR